MSHNNIRAHTVFKCLIIWEVLSIPLCSSKASSTLSIIFFEEMFYLYVGKLETFTGTVLSDNLLHVLSLDVPALTY